MRAILLASLMLLAGRQAFGEDDTDPARPAGPDATASPPLTVTTDAATDPADTLHAHYTTQAKWEVAGYNDNELVYHIFIHSTDVRILRCTTLLEGSYVEDGITYPVTDRQVTTVFPGQETQVGNWLGLDQKSGTRYQVQCRTL